MSISKDMDVTLINTQGSQRTICDSVLSIMCVLGTELLGFGASAFTH